MNTTDLTLIILHYNTPEFLQNLLKSLETHVLSRTAYQISVVVVDNASPDHSFKKVLAAFPKVECIQLEKNSGFAAGNNAALQNVTSRYAMLLNSDTECIAATNFDLLIAYMDEHPQVGMITPRVELDAEHHLDPASHRGEPTPWASLTYFSGLSKIFPQSSLFGQYHQTYKDFTSVHQIDACSGAALLVRVAAIKKVGLLDEQFFMYAEDLDWCRRFREAGYTIVYDPEVIILHHKYKSGRKNQDQSVSKKTSAYFYDTMLQYYDKYYRLQYPSFVRACVQFFINQKKGKI